MVNMKDRSKRANDTLDKRGRASLRGLGMLFWVLLLAPMVALRGAADDGGGSVPQRDYLMIPADEIPRLRAAVKSEAHRELWNEVLATADDLIDPESPHYADPEDVLAEARRSTRKSLYWNAARILGLWADTLGPAAVITGDPKYAEHGARLLVAMTEAVPLASPGILDESGLAKGEMAGSVGYAYEYFRDFLTEEERRQVRDYARDYVDHILDWDRIIQNPYSNWRAVSVSGAGYLALALREDYPVESQDWAGQALRMTREWMDLAFGPEGSYAEGAGYIEYAMRMVSPFATALANQGGPELMTHHNLRAVPAYLAMKLVPGAPILDNRNDAAFPGEATFGSAWISRFAGVNDDPLAAWLADTRDISERRARGYAFMRGRHRSFLRILWAHDVEPEAPEAADVPLARHFPGEGLAIWRTGWEPSDTLFTIAAGRYQVSGHDQSDEGHFNLYSHGVRWSSDPGYGNRNSPWDRGQGLAHSMVLVDGKATALSWSGRGTDGQVLDYLETTVRDDGQVLLESTAATPLTMEVADAPSARLLLAVSSDDPAQPELSTRERFAEGQEGEPFRVVRFGAEAVNPHFVSVLVPQASADEAPAIRFERDGETVTAFIEWPGHTDTVRWRKGMLGRPEFDRERPGQQPTEPKAADSE